MATVAPRLEPTAIGRTDKTRSPRRAGRGSALSPRRTAPIGAGLIVAYMLTAVVLVALPTLGVASRHALTSALAFSPADLVAGKLWLLPASGLIAQGSPWPQLAAIAELAAVLVVVADSRTFWRAAIAGHLGSTVIAYALVGILTLVLPASVQPVAAAPDYGVSCVWAGALGALAVVLGRRARNRSVAALVVTACALPVMVIVVRAGGFTTAAGALDLASVEHALAFVAGTFAATPGAAERSARSGPWWRSVRSRLRYPAAAAAERSASSTLPATP